MAIEKINKTRVLMDIESELLKLADKYRKKKSTPSHKISRRAVFEEALAKFLEQENA